VSCPHRGTLWALEAFYWRMNRNQPSLTGEISASERGRPCLTGAIIMLSTGSGVLVCRDWPSAAPIRPNTSVISNSVPGAIPLIASVRAVRAGSTPRISSAIAPTYGSGAVKRAVLSRKARERIREAPAALVADSHAARAKLEDDFGALATNNRMAWR
jgi:hypothetical protein